MAYWHVLNIDINTQNNSLISIVVYHSLMIAIIYQISIVVYGTSYFQWHLNGCWFWARVNTCAWGWAESTRWNTIDGTKGCIKKKSGYTKLNQSILAIYDLYTANLSTSVPFIYVTGFVKTLHLRTQWQGTVKISKVYTIKINKRVEWVKPVCTTKNLKPHK